MFFTFIYPCINTSPLLFFSSTPLSRDGPTLHIRQQHRTLFVARTDDLALASFSPRSCGSLDDFSCKHCSAF
jgi:hypothetical protein